MSAILSLCTGLGGLDDAVQWALGDFDSDPAMVCWHAEYDEALSEWYRDKEPWSVPLGDLKQIDWSAVLPLGQGRSNKDLIITAGYPCQPFSVAGRKLGAEDPRHLWPYVFGAIRELRPGLVVLENVRNHLRLGFGTVLADLASIGFDAEWSIVKASDVGAPHQRARLFVVAWPADAGSEGPQGSEPALS